MQLVLLYLTVTAVRARIEVNSFNNYAAEISFSHRHIGVISIVAEEAFVKRIEDL